MSSPWGKIAQVQPMALGDIMSEEVARDLQEKEFAAAQRERSIVRDCNQPKATSPTCANMHSDYASAQSLLCEEQQLQNDSEIALMLQQEYDKEYNELLKQRTEDKYNGSCKVSVSFINYQSCPLYPELESDPDEEEEPEKLDKDWDRFDVIQRDYKAMPPCGYRVKNGSMMTKHDSQLNARRNACRMMSLPPECETGDGAGFDMQLSNPVFNSLRKHSKNEQVRRYRFHDKREDRATAEFGLDEPTRLLLYKMINSQMLEHVNGVISIGKEAVVLHADCNQAYEGAQLPRECVLKVFKTTLSEYKQRDKYIRDDPRFKDRVGKQHARSVVHLWAEKETRNLRRLQKALVPAPRVLTLKQHVLVMTFIGCDHRPAPKLKDARLSAADLIIAYDQVVAAMHALYHKANLIHADLSEYNVLWYDQQCYLIDVSQSVEPMHENAFHFLHRDCTNVSNFFTKKGVPGVDSPDAIFKAIVGHEFNDRIALLELQESTKQKPHLVDRPGVEVNYCFERAWERSELAKKTAAATAVDALVA